MQLKVQASTFLNAVKTVGLTWDLKKKKWTWQPPFN